ncbi:MAG TPA: PilZ domain-containing protein [Pyrinomonadaceae bacterium]|nr:PilZ domain-containing protein [Pyrinomonadaceae bacterium]
MIRELVSRLNKSVSKRVVAPRREFSVPISVSIESDKHTGRLNMPAEKLTIRGETVDMSKTGIGFLVSAIRIKEYYLVGEDRTLFVELDLPNGRVKMQVVGRRYEHNDDIHSSGAQFLIGASISNITTENREAYEEFLRLGGKAKGKILQLKTDQS